MNAVEENIQVGDLLPSFGAGSGSRAANAGARGRQGGRNVRPGVVTRLRNRIASAQAGNRGRGSRARRAQLNELASRAQGNSRGNVNRRTARQISADINAVQRAIRAMGG